MDPTPTRSLAWTEDRTTGLPNIGRWEKGERGEEREAKWVHTVICLHPRARYFALKASDSNVPTIKLSKFPLPKRLSNWAGALTNSDPAPPQRLKTRRVDALGGDTVIKKKKKRKKAPLLEKLSGRAPHTVRPVPRGRFPGFPAASP